MKNILPLIKGYKRAVQSICFILILIFISFNGLAQSPAAPQVSVTVNILPPYSPYYSDYSGANAGKILLIVRNLTPTQKRIKLTGELQGDNGIRISTKSNYVPLQPIILLPNETRQLNGTALKDVFDLNSLNVYGIDKVKLVQTSRLPEGNYSFCLQAVDMNTNQVITNTAPLGCTSFSISYPNAPILISPTAFEKIEAKYSRTASQNITFSWMNPGTVPLNTQYIIQIAEMPDIPIYENGRVSGYTQNTKDPNQILNSTSVFVLNQRITGTSYIYGNGNRPLSVGKKYAWRVIATDPSNKTGFMNDGKSAANVFVFGSLEQLVALNPKLAGETALLNIINPACKNGGEIMYVGPNSNLNLTWLWKDQIESMTLFGTLDSNLLKHYTKVNVKPVGVNVASKSKAASAKSDLNMPEVFETIKYYALNLASKADKYGPAKDITIKVLAPKQSVNFTKKQVDSLGLKIGQTYKLTVAAVSDKSTIIKMVESCNWVLKAEVPLAIPKLVIKGKLNYSFDKKDYYGVNNTSISLQIVEGSTTKIAKFSGSGPFTKKLNIGYATTDANGNFTAEIDQFPSDTGKKFVAITINSPYYQQLTTNLAVNIPEIATYPDVKTNVRNQDALNLGNINTNVYHYDLTVILSKKFEGVYKDANGNDITIDKRIINNSAQLAAGILVGIYRKTKPDDMPKYEGNINQKGPQYPLAANYIRVAEAKTFIKDGLTQVVFNKLIFMHTEKGEYYIKAILPKANPNDKLQGDNDADLAAPEDYYAQTPWFYPDPTLTSYQNTYYYNIVSKAPPTARIKGKLMQQWPSQPGVLYPYANKSFTVKLNSENSLTGQKIATDACQYYPSAYRQIVQNADGTVSRTAIPGSDQSFNMIVATGTTDKDGNYEIPIFDFLNMRDFNIELVKTSNTPIGKTCAEIKAEEDAKEAARLAALLAAAQAQANTTDAGFVDGGIKAAELIERQIREQGFLTGEGLGQEQGSGKASKEPETLDIGGKGPHFDAKGAIDLVGDAVDKINKYGNVSSSSLNLQRFVSEDEDLNSNGPSAISNNLNSQAPAITGTLKRYFTFELPNYVNSTGNDVNQTVDKFVVQPFGSVNLGVAIVNIDEITDLKLKVKVKISNRVNDKWFEVTDAPDNNALTGAKLVVFRLNKTFPAPPGEGSAQHPVKKLINATYSDNTPKYGQGNENGGGNWKGAQGTVSSIFNGDVEWVLDETIGVVKGELNNATIDISNKRLWAQGKDYWALLTPNPDGSGGRFDPVIFKLPTYNVEVRIAPSRISGRVIDKNSSKAIANAVVSLEVSNLKTTKTLIADHDGYFNYTNGTDVNFTWTDNAQYKAIADVNGYSTSDEEKKWKSNIAANGNNYESLIEKSYGAIIKGFVKGEIDSKNSKAIDAYIVREDEYLISSKLLKNGNVDANSQYFKDGLPIMANKSQNVKVIPVDPAYFTKVFPIDPIASGGIVNQYFTLKRRLHRIQFNFTRKDGQTVAAGDLKITINNKTEDPKLSQLNLVGGKVLFEFENVSVNNYTIQIADASGKGYIPQIFNLKNEESEKPITQDIKMEIGAKISGYVKLNGAAVENARVYLNYSASDAIPTENRSPDIASLEAKTNKAGYYEIKGINTPDNVSLGVYATLNSATATIKGDYQVVEIKNRLGAADFALQKFDGPIINNVYGFPLSVENIQNMGDSKYKVSGIVDLSKSASAFTWLNPDSKIRISEVIFDGKNNNQPVDLVNLDAVKEIKMKYQDKYNVKLEQTYGTGLAIESAGNGKGAIFAKVSLTDNSFNFPSSYLNFTQSNENNKVDFGKPTQFYFSTPSSRASAQNITKVKAIYTDAVEQGKFYLSDKDGKELYFYFIGFKTFARANNSFIDFDGKIHLDINFKGEVPKSTPSTINIDIHDLVLDGNKINTTLSKEPLIVNLQTWKLEIKEWELNVEKGGIFSSKALIKTGLVDVPVGTFNLRSDMCVIKDFEVTQLSLGGGMLPLTGISKENTNFNLVFDEATGSDHSPHWRFSASSKGNGTVATIPIPKVVDKFDGVDLQVKYFQLISYNKEDLISLAGAETGVKLYNNPKFMFYPASVTSDVGSYSLKGNGKITVPRVEGFAMSLLFDKPNGGATDMKPMSFNLGFEGKGYVQFKNNPNASIVGVSAGVTGIRGTVEEPGKLNKIPCMFSFGTGNEGKIKLDQSVLNLDGVGEPSASSLTLEIFGNDIDKGLDGMKVENNDWTTLKFSGKLNDPESSKMLPKPDAKKPDPKPVFTFEVLGEIQASSKGISADKIATPLGDVSMNYDFASRRMTGSLRMNEVEFGSYKFSGDVEVGYGGDQGFLLLGAGQLNTGTFPLDGFGTFNIGLLFAGKSDLSDASISKVTQYSKAKENVCWLADNRNTFTGFFLSGGYDIINEKKGIDIGIAAIYFNAVVGVEASIGANFEKPSFRALIGAHADVTAGMSAITGTSISGFVAARIVASATYDPTGFSIAGGAGITLGYRVSQSLLVKTVTFDGSVDAGVRFILQKGGSDIKFFLGTDNGKSECQ